MKSESTNIRVEVLERYDAFSDEIVLHPMGRVMAAVSLFDTFDQLRSDHFPTDWSDRIRKRLDNLIHLSLRITDLFDAETPVLSSWNHPAETNEFTVRTGHVYSELWKDFNSEEYFDNTRNLLEQRFKRNNISLRGVRQVLDDGCGGGRYSVALRSLGAAKVTGIDISKDAISLANRRNPFPNNEVSFICGSVLELPFEDKRFDFVFSNGVLHHTESTEQGLEEIYRVTSPGGQVWLYLYGGKESLFWDTVDLCRRLLKEIPQAYTQTVMKVMGYSPGRIMHRCDFFYVPVHRRYFQSEVEAMLQEVNFSDFKRLYRGTDHDWDEIILNNPQIDNYIFGEGEMRFLITKDN